MHAGMSTYSSANLVQRTETLSSLTRGLEFAQALGGLVSFLEVRISTNYITVRECFGYRRQSLSYRFKGWGESIYNFSLQARVYFSL